MAPVGFEATILDRTATGTIIQYIQTVGNTMFSWNPVITPGVPNHYHISVLYTSDFANLTLFNLVLYVSLSLPLYITSTPHVS